ncbi:ABC transporter substrate-binding protein [Mycolicibacterium goodii]|uniref:ABC transporter substrate-binding protein n=1 Tax=Mycolicibacterium goodii TaxID=134601 RepID=UPI0018ECC3FC|nr:ABC transporter substrate-binding protein [Mycolicibacterium goodii]
MSSGTSADIVRQLVYNGLLAYDGNGEIVGDLAQDYGWVGRSTYKVRLRPGVRFHNGSPLTADDVVFSFRRILDPQVGGTARNLLSGVSSIDAIDNNTVQFTLSDPDAGFPYALASPTAMVVSEAWVESGVNPKTTAMGTGPFTLVERIPGVSITLRGFDDYFDPELPYLNAIVFSPMSDDYARVTALRAASVDIIDYVPATHIDVVQRNPNLSFASDRTFGFGWIGFVTDRPPFNDLRVRRAVALGLDRESILRTAFLGHGEVISGGLVPPAVASYSDALRGSMTYDPDQARSLLKQAGYDRLPMPMLSTSAYSVISRPAEASLPGLREAGIDVEMQQQDWQSFRKSLSAKSFPTHSWGARIAYGDPDALRDFVGSKGAYNNFNYSDDRVDWLLAQGRLTEDPAGRAEIYQDIEQRVLEALPLAYTVRREQGEALHTYVKGFEHPKKGTWTQVSLRKVWIEQ